MRHNHFPLLAGKLEKALDQMADPEIAAAVIKLQAATRGRHQRQKVSLTRALTPHPTQPELLPLTWARTPTLTKTLTCSLTLALTLTPTLALTLTLTLSHSSTPTPQPLRYLGGVDATMCLPLFLTLTPTPTQPQP